MEDQKITIEQLLAKIGELTIKLDIAIANVSSLKEKIAELEEQASKK